MKVAILFDPERKVYSVLGGSNGKEFTEAELRTVLGEALVGAKQKPTQLLAEARREGAVLVDCKPILKGLEMKRRPAGSQYANRTTQMIEAVARGADPATLVNRLAEHQPDDVYVRVFMEGDKAVFTDASDQVIPDGANRSVDEVQNMLTQIKEQDIQLAWSSDVRDLVDGYEGPLQMLYTRVQHAYAKSNSTSYGQKPEVDDFQRYSYGRALEGKVPFAK